MQIQSKKNRNFIVRALYNLIPDAVLALAITVAVDEGPWIFVAIIVGLQVLYLALIIKNSLWAWLLFKFQDRKRMTQLLLDYLIEIIFHDQVNI